MLTRSLLAYRVGICYNDSRFSIEMIQGKFFRKETDMEIFEILKAILFGIVEGIYKGVLFLKIAVDFLAE